MDVSLKTKLKSKKEEGEEVDRTKWNTLITLVAGGALGVPSERTADALS